MDTETAPELHTFPSEDARFRGLVADAFERVSPESPETLAAYLRPFHPLVVVRERNPLGQLDGRAVWYVFRDGETVPDDAEV